MAKYTIGEKIGNVEVLCELDTEKANRLFYSGEVASLIKNGMLYYIVSEGETEATITKDDGTEIYVDDTCFEGLFADVAGKIFKNDAELFEAAGWINNHGENSISAEIDSDVRLNVYSVSADGYQFVKTLETDDIFEAIEILEKE